MHFLGAGCLSPTNPLCLAHQVRSSPCYYYCRLQLFSSISLSGCSTSILLARTLAQTLLGAGTVNWVNIALQCSRNVRAMHVFHIGSLGRLCSRASLTVTSSSSSQLAVHWLRKRWPLRRDTQALLSQLCHLPRITASGSLFTHCKRGRHLARRSH